MAIEIRKYISEWNDHRSKNSPLSIDIVAVNHG